MPIAMARKDFFHFWFCVPQTLNTKSIMLVKILIWLFLMLDAFLSAVLCRKNHFPNTVTLPHS